MGLMFRRRRPPATRAAGAATAGVASHDGQRRSEQNADNEQAQEAYGSTQQMQYAPPPSAQPAQVAAPSGTADLDHLAQLHASGVLSDAEFTAAKAKLLGI